MIEISIFWLVVFGLFYFCSIFSVCLAFYKLNQKDLSELKNELRSNVVGQMSEDVRQEIYEKEKSSLFKEIKGREETLVDAIKSHGDIEATNNSVPNFHR